jgi:2-succinyl-6-hydroxy-2,4-cyclohexadiene-1-carboxylate synthase
VALALAGATPGIADAGERDARRRSDLALATSIEKDGIEAFSRTWEANPLFASQASLDAGSREAMRAQRLSQHPAHLAAALRAFGTGFQPPVHDRLASLAMPVLVMAGERDAKFTAIAHAMAEHLPNATVRIMPGAGHAVPLEAPAAFAAELDAFLKKGSDPFSEAFR